MSIMREEFEQLHLRVNELEKQVQALAQIAKDQTEVAGGMQENIGRLVALLDR